MNEKIRLYLNEAMDWCVHSLPSFILAILFLVVGWWLIGRAEKLLAGNMIKRNVESSLHSFLRTLFSLGAKIILVILVAGQVGIQTTSLAAIVGAASLAVGLALQGSLANLAGGVLILIFKPFKIGDTILASGFTGCVKEIQIFNTILLLHDNKLVTIPNGALSNSAIVNNNAYDFLKVDVPVCVPADKDINQFKEKLKEFLSNDEKVLANPPVKVEMQEVTGKTVKLVVSIFCKPDDLHEVQVKANENLLLFFKFYEFSF